MTRPRRWPPLALALAALALVTGLGGFYPGARASAPVERVVSVVPAATEMLFAMGAGELLVAVGSYDSWPPEVEELPRVGAYLDPDLERMIDLRADLAVIDAGQAALARRLEAAGIATFRFAHGGLEDALATMEELGTAVGRPEAGRELATGVRDELDALQDRLADRPRPDTLLVFGRTAGFGDLWVVGRGQFLHELLRIAGGRNVFGDVDRLSFKAGLEAVLARRPAVVLEAGLSSPPGGADDATAREAVRREWRGLPGFADVRVGLLPDHALVPGPRMPETARRMARILHGDAALDGPEGRPAAGDDGAAAAEQKHE